MIAASAALGSWVDWERAPRQADGRGTIFCHRQTDPKCSGNYWSSLLYRSSEKSRSSYRSVRRTRTTGAGRTHLGTVRSAHLSTCPSPFCCPPAQKEELIVNFLFVISAASAALQRIRGLEHGSVSPAGSGRTARHTHFHQHPASPGMHIQSNFWLNFVF